MENYQAIFHFLPQDQMAILRKIIVTTKIDGINYYAEFVYVRPFGLNKEDELDKKIETNIRNRYTILMKQQQEIFFEEDIAQLKKWLSFYQCVDAHIYICPSIPVDDLPKLAGVDIYGFIIPIWAYVNNDFDELSKTLYGNCDLYDTYHYSKQKEQELLQWINNNVPTLLCVRDYVANVEKNMKKQF